MTYIGFTISMVGFMYACYVIYLGLDGIKVPSGWHSLMVINLILGGLQLIMLGILGEYLWRNLDEARSRPQFLIESDTSTNEK